MNTKTDTKLGTKEQPANTSAQIKKRYLIGIHTKADENP